MPLCHTCSKSIVVDIFNPGHNGIVYIRFVTSFSMINRDLNSEGLIRIKRKWPEANDFTMEITKGGVLLTDLQVVPVHHCDNRTSNANVTVDWMVYQGTPVGGVADVHRILVNLSVFSRSVK